MRASIKTLLEQYQVRKTIKQKNQFTQWCQQHATQHGYEITEQTFKRGRGKNLIVGSVSEAVVIMCAHYDTPPNAIFPIVTVVGNIPMYLLSQALIFLPIMGVFLGIHFFMTTFITDGGLMGRMIPFFWSEIPLLSFVLLVLWTIQMMMGVANRKNANDNSSGVSVLLALLEDLPQLEREKVCFVFFDEEEKGLEGAKAFKRQYQGHIYDKPLINFDCVAHGKHLMFITKKAFRQSTYHDQLKMATENKALLKSAKKYVYPSDQLIFKNSVGVTALHKLPVVGYYLSRLHSRFDHKFEVENIEKLNQMMQKFVSNIPGPQQIDEKNEKNSN